MNREQNSLRARSRFALYGIECPIGQQVADILAPFILALVPETYQMLALLHGDEVFERDDPRRLL